MSAKRIENKSPLRPHTRPPLPKGEALSKLQGKVQSNKLYFESSCCNSAYKKALLIGELAVQPPERSFTLKLLFLLHQKHDFYRKFRVKFAVIYFFR